MANLFTYFDGALHIKCTAVVHRNESVLKNIFERGYKEIRDRKLLEILKKDRTWLKYELYCNVKTPAPLFYQNNLTFVIQMLINVFPRIVFVRTFFLHISRESNNIYCFCLIIFVLIY